MTEFFKNLSSLEQTYWGIALLGSLIFVIIAILTFLGGGDADMETDSTDFEADDGGVGFQFFTFKNLIAFFTIFGWSGLVAINNNMALWSVIVISFLCGLVMMSLTASMFYYMNKLTSSGTLNFNNAIGKIGEVYVPIGANNSRTGKVQITVQGSIRELSALTDSTEDLTTGTVVKVVEIVNTNILKVEKLNKK